MPSLPTNATIENWVWQNQMANDVAESTAFEQELTVQTLTNPVPAWAVSPSLKKPPAKRKRFNQDSTDTVSEIFGGQEPAIINPVEAIKFIELQGLVKPSIRPFQVSNPKTLIGIEVEVENVLKVDPNIPIMFWNIKEDGSLRNHGREFVTPGALPMSFAEPALRQLFNGLNSDIDFSHRTSIHAHLDVRQLTLKQVVSLLLVYTTVENLLFKFVGNNRRTNIFCVPITETGVLDGMAANPARFVHSIETSWHKYTALNLLPIQKFGSMEFRHMPGTKNINLILCWLDMLSRMKTYVYKTKYEDIVSQILALNSNSMYKQFVESIFGDLCAYLDMSNLLMDMERPVYFAKNSAAANIFHETVVNKPNPDSFLGQRLNGWLLKLSEEQRAALRHCADIIFGTDDLEHVFHELIRRPQAYLDSYPTQEKYILSVIKGNKMDVKKAIKAPSVTISEGYNF